MERFERFWSKVDKTGECWVWTATTTTRGYGQFKDGPKLRQAHRVAYEMEVGPIPEGMELDHLCRNRACVNPAHLEAVTHAENVRRGISPSAVGAVKTHCVKGHPLSGDNLRLSKGGRHRICRACRAISLKKWKAKNRG